MKPKTGNRASNQAFNPLGDSQNNCLMARMLREYPLAEMRQLFKSLPNSHLIPFKKTVT